MAAATPPELRRVRGNASTGRPGAIVYDEILPRHDMVVIFRISLRGHDNWRCRHVMGFLSSRLDISSLRDAIAGEVS